MTKIEQLKNTLKVDGSNPNINKEYLIKLMDAIPEDMKDTARVWDINIFDKTKYSEEMKSGDIIADSSNLIYGIILVVSFSSHVFSGATFIVYDDDNSRLFLKVVNSNGILTQNIPLGSSLYYHYLTISELLDSDDKQYDGNLAIITDNGEQITTVEQLSNVLSNDKTVIISGSLTLNNEDYLVLKYATFLMLIQTGSNTPSYFLVDTTDLAQVDEIDDEVEPY